MPFGMKTAAATLARLMRKVTEGIHGLISCFDDIIGYSDTWEAHIDTLRNLFRKLRQMNLTIRPSKCVLGSSEVSCLGHIVGNGVLKADPGKVKAMVDFPLPSTKIIFG